MVTAFVFIQAETDKIPEVADQVAALEGVAEVYSVTGKTDLIAVVRGRDYEDVEKTIANGTTKVAGILDTETALAFRAYSRTDLGAAFSLGAGD